MSFASEPERDDGGLPPVNIVIPDDARELDRDVLAYRREMRAQRRRQRFLRLLRPFYRSRFGGPTAIVPLIALCLALALVGGALLSVVTMNPADPTVTTTPTPGQADQPSGPTALPAGNVRGGGQALSVRSLVGPARIRIVRSAAQGISRRSACPQPSQPSARRAHGRRRRGTRADPLW